MFLAAVVQLVCEIAWSNEKLNRICIHIRDGTFQSTVWLACQCLLKIVGACNLLCQCLCGEVVDGHGAVVDDAPCDADSVKLVCHVGLV